MAVEKKTSELNEFLAQFVSLPEQIIKGMLSSSSDEDLKMGIKAYSKPLQEQFNGISQHIQELMSTESSQNVLQANKLVNIASGKELVNSASSISKNLKSMFSRLSLNSIIKEIKKILIFILDLLKVPEWVYKILLIIDQILNALFGWDLPDTMPELLSLLEVGFYNELAAQSRFINSMKKEERE